MKIFARGHQMANFIVEDLNKEHSQFIYNAGRLTNLLFAGSLLSFLAILVKYFLQ